MSDDQDGCEWVSVSSGTGLPGCPGPKAIKRLCVYYLTFAQSISWFAHDLCQIPIQLAKSSTITILQPFRDNLC